MGEGKKTKPLKLQNLICNSISPTTDEWRISLKNKNIEEIKFIRENYEKSFDCIAFVPRMQFSIMNYGCFIPPHTDVSNKLATIMIYLPQSEVQKRSMLGTSYWNSKEDKSRMKQSESKFLMDKERISFDKRYNRIRTSFNNEKMPIFFRSDESWHSFEYDCDNTGPRLSININLLYPVSSSV